MDNVIRRRALEVFLYLQVLDVMSTLIGFSLGNAEASPFIRLLVRWGPLAGLESGRPLGGAHTCRAGMETRGSRSSC